MKTDLHRWMILDNVCYANGFRTDGVLDNFLEEYELFDQIKQSDTRDFFIDRLCKLAKKFTCAIKDQRGLKFDTSPSSSPSSHPRLAS